MRVHRLFIKAKINLISIGGILNIHAIDNYPSLINLLFSICEY